MLLGSVNRGGMPSAWGFGAGFIAGLMGGAIGRDNAPNHPGERRAKGSGVGQRSRRTQLNYATTSVGAQCEFTSTRCIGGGSTKRLTPIDS
jgi:hypothetical protein